MKVWKTGWKAFIISCYFSYSVSVKWILLSARFNIELVIKMIINNINIYINYYLILAQTIESRLINTYFINKEWFWFISFSIHTRHNADSVFSGSFLKLNISIYYFLFNLLNIMWLRSIYLSANICERN